MPVQEYCFLWIDWWPMCMTKAEWSVWMQAIGSIMALAVAITLPYWERRVAHNKNFQMAKQCLLQQVGLLEAIRVTAASRGPREALLSSRESIEALASTYHEVRVSELPAGSLPSFLSARTSAGQLSSLVAGLKNLAGSDDGLSMIIGGYLTTTSKCLKDFAKHSSVAKDKRH